MFVFRVDVMEKKEEELRLVVIVPGTLIIFYGHQPIWVDRPFGDLIMNSGLIFASCFYLCYGLI
ncbi:hypothetical protein B0T17DRAFT_526893 [Bombardia bombarda]|uniref:Uncharacterized protein n=1 Tax=Bombardia bombarda TaxID=252184 RepID=A0AA39XA03_9PEZI|nr:hypothetical protein B0T17DRAFT_526893 [Bombardia bombarda]